MNSTRYGDRHMEGRAGALGLEWGGAVSDRWRLGQEMANQVDMTQNGWP